MSPKACGALALLPVLAGCDKLRALPGFEPAPAPSPPSVPVAMGPWLIEPLPGRVTVAWTTLEASLGRVWYGTAEPGRLALAGGTPDTGAAYARFFQRRDRPTYASLDYGPVHVVVLDAFEMRAGATPRLAGISDVQKAWFEEDLRGVSPDRHVWVLVHQGPFAHPAEMREGHGGSDEVRAALAGAHKIHPIEAVFAGHEAFYERWGIDGMRYFVMGAGGAPL